MSGLDVLPNNRIMIIAYEKRTFRAFRAFRANWSFRAFCCNQCISSIKATMLHQKRFEGVIYFVFICSFLLCALKYILDFFQNFFSSIFNLCHPHIRRVLNFSVWFQMLLYGEEFRDCAKPQYRESIFFLRFSISAFVTAARNWSAVIFPFSRS